MTNPNPTNPPPDAGEYLKSQQEMDDETLEELGHHAFRAMFQAFATVKEPKSRALKAVAQSLGLMIGLTYANKGHKACAADVGTVIRDYADNAARMTTEEREALIQATINELNNLAKAAESASAPKLILPVVPKLN